MLNQHSAIALNPSATSPNLSHLFAFAEALNQQNDFSETLRLVTQQAAGWLRADLASIFMINPRTRHTVRTLCHVGALANQQRYHAIHQQVAGWVMTHRAHAVAGNHAQIRCVCAHQGQGLVLGSLLLANKANGENFSEEDEAYLVKLVLLAAPYLRNAHKIAEYFDAPIPEAALLSKYRPIGLIGRSPKFIELLKTIEAAARCDVRVLLEGQTGTGKELIARAIHQFSARSSHPFIAMDCGAIPENLIESELFGHVKGAFTGAQNERKGLFEEAQRGTLFMDEVANLPLNLQTKFMRVLEQNEIRPLGSNATRKIDVRLIAASSRALREMVKQQLFREDLYYRLHVYPIVIPALHERQEDIPLLAEHFLQAFARQQQKQSETFDAELLEYMRARSWPGNVRQLENFVERLVTLASPAGKILAPDILPPDLKAEFAKSQNELQSLPITSSLAESVAAYEAKLVRQALIAAKWNQSQAARHCACPCKRCNIACTSWGL